MVISGENGNERSKIEMTNIKKSGVKRGPEHIDSDVQKISLVIPAWLHREAQLHRIETGESMTKLIVRLLTEELG